MVFKLPNLGYSYDALEPYFDSRTMEIHYTKHHQTYIDKLNSALLNLKEFSDLSIELLVSRLNLIPDQKRDVIRNNSGGHINHSFFWESLKYGTFLKEGSLKKAIDRDFLDFENFKREFEAVSINHFGSGWIWLINQDNSLKIISTNNQDNPLMGMDFVGVYGQPILGLDVWEHAYYLRYQNRRLDYIQAFWNVVNWDKVSDRFDDTFLCST